MLRILFQKRNISRSMLINIQPAKQSHPALDAAQMFWGRPSVSVNPSKRTELLQDHPKTPLSKIAKLYHVRKSARSFVED